MKCSHRRRRRREIAFSACFEGAEDRFLLQTPPRPLSLTRSLARILCNLRHLLNAQRGRKEMMGCGEEEEEEEERRE